MEIKNALYLHREAMDSLAAVLEISEFRLNHSQGTLKTPWRLEQSTPGVIGYATGAEFNILGNHISKGNADISEERKPSMVKTPQASRFDGRYLYFDLKGTELNSNSKESNVKSIASGEIKTILIIEDDPALLNIVQMKFRRKGHRVLSASDVSEAEEVWAMARNVIDVVISDNRLGYDLGSELLQRFQKQEPNVQYVLCSGKPLEQEVPGIPFLMKPFNLDAFGG